MRRLLILAFLFVALSVRAQYQNFYCNITGTNINAGTTTNATPTFSDVSGNWTNATQTFQCSGVFDLSVVTNGMFASVYVDGATVATYIGRVTAVNDAADFITVSNQSSSGTAPADGTGNRSIRVEGAFYGPRAVDGYSEPFPIAFLNCNMTNTAQNPTKIWFKGDHLYTVGSNIVNSLINTRIQGYTNVIGDNGIAYIYGATNLGTMFYTLLRQTGAGWHFKNLAFRGGGTNASGAIHTNMVDTTAVGIMERCMFLDAWETGHQSTGAGTLVDGCLGWNCNINAASGKSAFGSTVSMQYRDTIAAGSGLERAPGDGNSGFDADGDNTVYMQYTRCAALFNGGSGWDFQGSRVNATLDNCLVYHCGLNGISASVTVITNLSQINCYNTIFARCTNYAFRGFSGQVVNFTWGRFFNCGFFENLNNITNVNPSNIVGSINFSTTPFIDAANGNFILTNTVGGGLLAINAGWAPWLQSTGFTSATFSYLDVGPAQVTNSAAAAGGGVETRILRR